MQARVQSISRHIIVEGIVYEGATHELVVGMLSIDLSQVAEDGPAELARSTFGAQDLILIFMKSRCARLLLVWATSHA